MTQELYPLTKDYLLDRKQDSDNPYIKQSKIVFGTRKPHPDYQHGIVNEDEIVAMELKPDIQFNAGIFAWAGIGKTRLLKRFAYYFYHLDYDVIIADPKHMDWVTATKSGDGERLLEFEKKDKLPVYYCTPSFTITDLPFDKRDIFNDKHIYTHKLRNIKTFLEWSTLDIKNFVAVSLLTKLAKETNDLMEIARHLSYLSSKEHVGEDSIFSQTAKSITNRLSAFQEFKLFDENYDELNIEKQWKDKKIVACSYFSRAENFMQLDVGKNIQQIKDIREKYREFKPLIQIFDDAGFYANNYLKQTESLSMKNIINSLIAWRSLGFNSIFCIQNPNKINSEIVEECKHLFIGKMSDYDGIKPYITDEAYQALQLLQSDEKRYLHQWMWYKPDRTFELFYPLGCIVGH